MADKIITNENLLKEPCLNVLSIKEGTDLVDKLFETLDQSENGIGLAANQIGINKRVCVLSIPDNYGKYKILVSFINPVIVSKSEPVIFSGEGCLSFPNKNCETLRYNKIKVVDEENPEGRTFSGIYAVAAYHEIDHLDGITMFERRLNTISPNDKCHCGSNLKFKKCCMRIAKKFELIQQEKAE